MATHLSMVFDQRKHYIYHSNFDVPIAGLCKISNQTQFSQEKQKINISSKETAAELKLVQEWRSKNVEIEPPASAVDDDDDDDEFLEAQAFLGEPVPFYFGDDYGNQLFLDLQEELEKNRLLSYGGRGINVVEDIKYSSDDIYILSPEAGMIYSFLRDNLF